MFERLSMERIVQKMIRWTRGTNSGLTDFRVGSKIRTIYEAVGIVIEEFYDKVFRLMKQVIEDNIYSVIGFDKISATHASGMVRMSRNTPAETNYLIPAGTEVLSRATQYKSPIKFRTYEDALLQEGSTYVDIAVVASIAGVDGNVGAGDINDFVQKPTGVESITNLSAIDGGVAEESTAKQKERFQAFIEANARGVLQSIEYGAGIARIVAEDGTILERVHQARALEFLPERKGEVDLYVWNGVGEASEELIKDIRKVLTGYRDENGEIVYGYKAGGIDVNIYTANVVSIVLKLVIEYEDWVSREAVQIEANAIVDAYFGKLNLGGTFYQTALEAEIKYIEGVRDIKLLVSVDDGETYTMDNITASFSDIIIPKKPLVFE